MQKCFGCPYDAKKCIGSAGNPNADIVIVGEAPGGEEMIQGRPFIGPSGKLLYRALARAGIDNPEESCFITNAISCRPPDKEAPTTAALEACRMRLVEEINAHPRKLVIGLGNSALRSLDCNMKAKISQERGQPKPNNPYLAMYTWHPAAVLRDGNRWPQMREDIAYAVSIATGGAIRRNPGESSYVEVRDDETAIEWAEKLADKKLLAADIETSGLNPRNDRITYLGISYRENETVIFPKEFIHHLRPVFESGPRWIWHNGKFDTYFLQEMGMPARCDEDVMLMHYATCEQRGTHDLKQLSQDLLGAENYEDGVKEWIRKEKVKRRKDARSVTKFYARQKTAAKNIIKMAWERAEKAFKKKAEKTGAQVGVVQDYLYYNLTKYEYKPPEIAEVKPLEGYADVPDDILLPYLAKDCDYTWQLYAHLRMIIDEDPALKHLYETVLMPSSRFLQRVEKRGIFVDQGALKKLKVELTARKEAALGSANTYINPLWKPEDYLADTGAKTAPEHFNVASSKQLHWVLYNRIGMRPPKGVKPTTNKAVLPLLSPINNPVIPLILDYRKAAKMLSTYVIGVELHIDKYGRVHSTYKIHGTETGRLSSADPNMQNIPSDSTIKNIFAAPPGFVLLEMDYSQAELRTLACLSGDEALTEIYLKGLDLHYEMCVEIYGDRFLSCNDKGELERLRRGAKTVNFGICYGMGEGLLASRLDIDPAEAARMIEVWFNRFPKAAEYLKLCRSMPRLGRYVDTPFGRRRRFPLVTAETLHKLQNEAANFPIQSVASDLTLMSGMELDGPLEALGVSIVNIVHDSLLLQVPEDDKLIREVFLMARATMIQTPIDYLGPEVPFDADGKIGINWGNCYKYKLDAPLSLRKIA